MTQELHKVRVHYPNGYQFYLPPGIKRAHISREYQSLVCFLADNDVLLLDPRAWVISERTNGTEGPILYQPTLTHPSNPAWMNRW